MTVGELLNFLEPMNRNLPVLVEQNNGVGEYFTNANFVVALRKFTCGNTWEIAKPGETNNGAAIFISDADFDDDDGAAKIRPGDYLSVKETI